MGGLTHVFPSTEQLTSPDPDPVAMLYFPRRRTLITLIAAMADGDVEVDAGRRLE